jgi:uncharacterized protein YbaA (DUF1428 family)
MSYVDVYVLPVPRDRLADYRRLARLGCKVWMEHGALDYVECIEDNIDPGKRTSFPRAVKRGPDEVVIVAWIVFKSRAHRNRVNKLAMTDPRMTAMDPKSVPVDGKRMFWGGFKPFVQA